VCKCVCVCADVGGAGVRILSTSGATGNAAAVRGSWRALSTSTMLSWYRTGTQPDSGCRRGVGGTYDGRGCMRGDTVARPQ
jgi:hypothetical protein